MLIKLEDIYKAYGSAEVLKGVTFQVNPGEHVGLVGRNGAGKTTIFRLIAGKEEADRGSLARVRGLKLGVLDQQPVFASDTTVRDEALKAFSEIRELEQEISRLEHEMAETAGVELEEILEAYSELRHRHELLEGFSYEARAGSVLTGLGFKESDFDTLAVHLSGGQKARLALARMLLSQPSLLLLDEPTNHLDIQASEWLEDFLIEYGSAFIIISHDRFLLDRVASRIVEIDNGKASAYPGNYTAYVRQREERILAASREYEKQQELIARTEDFVRRNIAGQKTKQAKSRRNMLERMERVEAVTSDLNSLRLDLGKAEKTQPQIGRASALTVSDLEVGYPGKTLASGIDFILQQGDRLGIIGPNGCGKTTLLKTLLGNLEPRSGTVSWSATSSLAYYEQELSGLDLSATVMDEVGSVYRLSAKASSWERELRGFLARFNFTGDDAFKPVSALSGGERSRVALARLVCSKANVLVLDEPTNHLDIASREAVESALRDYPGTIVVVSHDRYFLDRIATSLLVFENGEAKFHWGSYSEYYDERHATAVAADRPTVEADNGSEPKADATPQRKPVIGARTRRPQKQSEERALSRIEEQIAALEQELGQVADQLSNPPPGLGPQEIARIGNRHQELSTQLSGLYDEWESAAQSTSR